MRNSACTFIAAVSSSISLTVSMGVWELVRGEENIQGLDPVEYVVAVSCSGGVRRG